MQGAHKKYMSIAVSVLTTSCAARNNGGATRQELKIPGGKATRSRQLHVVPAVMCHFVTVLREQTES